MTLTDRTTISAPLLYVVAAGVFSALTYVFIFVVPFPLNRLYDTIPPVDYAKLTGHSPRGMVAFVAAVLFLFVAYGLALQALRRLSCASERQAYPGTLSWAWGIVIVGTLVFSIALALAYPTAAIDVLIYAVRTRGWALWDLNPLATAPQSIPGDVWVGLAAEWLDAPSPYGTVWEGLSLLAWRLAGGDFLTHLYFLKAITTSAHLGCVLLVALFLRRIKPELALVGAAAFGWNPLALLESANNGHNDVVMVFFLLLAVLLCVCRRLRWLVVPALALSAMTKFVPVIVLPFFLLYLYRQREDWPGRIGLVAANLVLGAGLSLALMAPVWPGWDQWAVRDIGSGAGKSPFALLVLLLRPWLGTNAAFDVSRYFLGGVFVLIYLWLAWRAWKGPLDVTRTVILPSYLTFYCYLVLPNQQFHAWYLLWPLSMAVFLFPSADFMRLVVFELTAWLSIPIYETMRVWWWDTLTPLVVHMIAVPLVFGLPFLLARPLKDYFDRVLENPKDELARLPEPGTLDRETGRRSKRD